MGRQNQNPAEKGSSAEFSPTPMISCWWRIAFKRAHTQISYIKSGSFEFTIEGEKRIVREGDTLLKTDGVEHGCVCLEEGIVLDAFSPYRKDFVSD